MARDLIGETLLGQFRVQTYMAAGGMATIYRVWDVQRNVPLAMKVLRPELAEDPVFLNRFEREAASLQQLIHPHIVPFYGIYRDGDLTFLLERFIDGPSLEEVLRGRAGSPLPLSDALVVFKALYTSLGYAHSHGIVHCDVKPGNVLIDRGGAIYLTDFGIARFVNAALTSTSIAGTPLYMAPEQFRGEPVSPATDVYLLGVLMYELLTGRRPFNGSENLPPEAGEGILDRVRWQHMNQPAPDARAANPNLPAALAAAVRRAMEKDPAARFPNVQAMVSAFSEAVGAQIDSLPDRLRAEHLLAVPEAPPLPRPGLRDRLSGWWAGLGRRDAIPNRPAGGDPQPGSRTASRRTVPDARQSQDARLSEAASFEATRPAPAFNTPSVPRVEEAGDTISAFPQDPRYAEPAGSPPPGPPPPRSIRWRAVLPLLGLLIVLGLCGAAVMAAARGWRTSAAQTTPLPGLPTETPRPTHTLEGDQPTQAVITATAASLEPTTAPTEAAVVPPLSNLPPGQIVIVQRIKGHDMLSLVDLATGAQEELPEVIDVPQNLAMAPVFSPDGQKLAFQARYKGRMHIAVMDMTEREPYQIGAAERYDNVAAPAWLPDSRTLSFYGTASGAPLLVTADTISGEEQQVYRLPQYRNLFAWSPAGGRLAYAYQDGALNVRIATSPDSAEWTIDSGGEEYAPAWSPDGALIAFQGDGGREPGRNEIWIAAADGSAPRPITTTPPEYWSRAPTWSPDGRYIAYVSNQAGGTGSDYGELFVVEVATGQSVQVTFSDGAVYDWRPAWRP